MCEEIWKDIEDFPNYQVSNRGRVRNKIRGECIHQQLRKSGYVKVALWKNGKEYTRDVHRLVALAFIERIDNKNDVNHIDGDKSNNTAINLEWCDRKENMQHAIRNGLFTPIAPEPRRIPVRIIETGEIFESATACAKAIGSSHGNVLNALKDECLDHHSVHGLHFEYVDKTEVKKQPFLRDYQLDAVSRMKNGCILCGGVGSGKSRTALYYYFALHGGNKIDGYTPMKNPRDLYIITTAKKRDSMEWDQEMVPFLLSTNPESNYYDNKVVIDSWNNIKKYSNVSGAVFLLDEQRLVGSGAWVKAFLKIAKRNHWVLLSATPGDSWEQYIPVFVANGFYKNKTEFLNEHVVYARYTKYPKIDKYINTGRLIRQRNDILVDMDFERPTTPHHEDVYVNYDISKYKEAMRTRWDPYKNQPIQQASGLCYVLRRIVNEDESRQVALLELFEKHPKMIVFYNFDFELSLLRSIFEPTGVKLAEWNGHNHQPVPEGKTWVYLVQYTAGAEGWNCITTDTIVFYSQNYSYKVMQQAAGRIDRMNTKYLDLYYYHLKSRSSIDLAISRALSQKKKFNESKWVKWDEKPLQNYRQIC